MTFTEDVTLHLNGDEVHVIHVPPAHTDGDSIVHFKKANVIHTGDAVIPAFPLVDADSGGTFDGFIAAADKVLSLADDNTKIIPGHGPVMTKADVTAFRQMLIEVRDRVVKLMAAKKTVDESEGGQAAGRPGGQVGPGVRSRRLGDRQHLQDARGDAGRRRQGPRQARRHEVAPGEGGMRGRGRLWVMATALLIAASSTARADALSAVRARGELRWGADEQGGEPYVYEDRGRGGALVGFEVDLADALARALGVRARFVQNDWSTLIPSLERGDFDVALNGIEVTPALRGARRVLAPLLPVHRAAGRAPGRRARARSRVDCAGCASARWPARQPGSCCGTPAPSPSRTKASTSRSSISSTSASTPCCWTTSSSRATRRATRRWSVVGGRRRGRLRDRAAAGRR